MDSGPVRHARPTRVNLWKLRAFGPTAVEEFAKSSQSRPNLELKEISQPVTGWPGFTAAGVP